MPEDLASGAARDLVVVDELDVPWTREAGEPAATPTPDVGRRTAAAGFQHNHGLDRLTPAGVGHADSARFADRRMRVQRLLPRGRVDALTAGLDEVLEPIDVRIAPILMAHEHIAGVQPAAAEHVGRRGGILEVTRNHARTTHDAFARHSDGKLAKLLIDDPDVEQRCGSLAEGRCRSREDKVERDDEAALGLAEGVPEADSESGREVLYDARHHVGVAECEAKTR